MIKILFLGANPDDYVEVKSAKEASAISKALWRARYGHFFNLQQLGAVQVEDLQEALLQHRPDIVHFSGHGTSDAEIILEDENGTSYHLPKQALTELFTVHKTNIKCVVLNACYSETQARAIAKEIPCVIGSSSAISDVSARNFSNAFYQALAYGETIENAYQSGCLGIKAERDGEADIPRIHYREPSAATLRFQPPPPLIVRGLQVALVAIVLLTIGMGYSYYRFQQLMAEAVPMAGKCITTQEASLCENVLAMLDEAKIYAFSDGTPYYYGGEIYYFNKQSALAKFELESAIVLNGLTDAQRADSHFYLADILYGPLYDSVPLAIEKLKRAIATQPDHLEARGLLGVIYIDMGDWTEARRTTAQALNYVEQGTSDVSPSILFTLYRNMADIEANNDEIQIAIALYEEALESGGFRSDDIEFVTRVCDLKMKVKEGLPSREFESLMAQNLSVSQLPCE